MRNLIFFILLAVILGIVFFNDGFVSNQDSTREFGVLIVAGHEPQEGGGRYRELHERNLNVALGKKISLLLEKENRYKIFMARDEEAWNSELSKYFETNRSAILEFKNSYKLQHEVLVAMGKWKEKISVMPHTDVDEDSAVRLYGLNKWANENEVDLVLHIHFNDSNRRDVNLTGMNKGFTIFVPDSQLQNAVSSRKLGQMIYDRLKTNFRPQLGSRGELPLLEDQVLIALGAYNTLEKPSILIEYAYIYEDMLQSEASREKMLDLMAEHTVSGIREYFKKNR